MLVGDSWGVEMKYLAVLLVLGFGCSKSEDVEVEGDQTPVDDTAEPAADDTAAPEEDAPLLNGLYSSGFLVGPVAGLIVGLQLEFEMVEDEEGNRLIEQVILRAANDEGEVSEDLAVATNIAVDGDGNMSVDWPIFTLPAAFSPTSGDVDIKSVMNGQIQSEDFVCGEVTGEIVSFEMDLAGSTFGTTRWENRILGTPSGCPGAELEEVERLADCPVMEEGRTTDFPSGPSPREYELRLPEGYDGSTPAPLVVVFHGIASNIDAMLGAPSLLDEASRTGHIVIAPQALDRGGTAAWDPVGAPAYNLDIALFDDMVSCMSEQYNIDPERVHVTGMSLGGIFTGTLIATRSDVIASAAPFSGGIFREKADGWAPIPTLVSWGGEEDIHYGQDFENLATLMTDQLTGDGHFVINCNHELGHSLSAELWPYAFRFLMDHPRGVEPLPYAGAELPEEFPDYCSIVE